MQPSVSIVTVSYNTPVSIFFQSLESVKRQTYPQQKIEHIVMDGGSINGAQKLAKSFGCKVFDRPDLLNKALVRMSLGLKKAHGDIILFLEPDNILTHTNWLAQMVLPFMENKNIVGTFSMYNDFTSEMPLLTKYCALFGVNDPLVYYLHKSEKLPRFKSSYDLGKILKMEKKYYLVKFDRQSLPTLGDNGHLVRRELIQKVNTDPEKFIHVDAFANLLDMGYGTYGVVKNSIIHYTGANIFQLLHRRTAFKEQFYNQRSRDRTYFVFDSRSHRDRLNLFRFVVFSLTFIEPLAESVRGYMSVRDPAWFLHPVICFAMAVAYGWSEIRFQLKRLFYLTSTS